MSDFPTVDQVVLGELKDILEDGFAEILIEFKDEIPLYKQQMETFVIEKDTDNLLMLAHSIKSSSGNLGFLKISDYCRGIEEGLRENPDMNVTNLVECCQHEFDVLKKEIKVIISGL